MVGEKINQYEILKKLGSGGQGTVYQALDTKLDRTVVSKFYRLNLPQKLQTSNALNEKQNFALNLTIRTSAQFTIITKTTERFISRCSMFTAKTSGSLLTEDRSN